MLIKILLMNELLPKFQDDNDAFIMWGNLLRMHEKSYKGREFFLKNMLFSIEMEEVDSLPNHFLKIRDIIYKLKSIDKTMEEEDMVVITLKHFPSSYEIFIETLNISSNDKDMTFE
jgi:hypothetical protein